MKECEVNGRRLAIGIDKVHTGHRLTVWEYDGNNWQVFPDWNDVLCVMSTEFESLCDVASELFGEAVYAEDMAHKLDIPVRFYDDADCMECGAWYHYAEMTELPNGDYVCTDCEAVSMINESEEDN